MITNALPATAPPIRSSSETLAEKISWTVAAVIGAAYLICIVRLTSFPMQDYANHVARAAVMADLLFHQGARFGQIFQVHLTPLPYVLPDLILMSAVEIFGVAAGAAVFSTLVILSLPCALLFYAHSCNIARRALPFVFLLGLYLSIDWFFIAGFLAFRLSLALIVVSLAFAEILRRRWSLPLFGAYMVVLIVGYLTHLTAPLFMAAALGVSGVVRLCYRTTTLRREICLLVPLAMLLVAYFGVMAPSHVHSAAVMKDWGGPGGTRPWVNKIRNLRYAFMGFDRQVTVSTLVLFAACLLWPIYRARDRLRLGNAACVEQLALVATFLGVYVVLPFEDQITLYVSIRALPMVTILLVVACLRLPAEESAGPIFGDPRVVGLAALLAVANLVYATVPLNSNNTWISHYRAIVSSVPPGAYVLPVHTETSQQYIVHVASHVVTDRGAITPYLFSANFGDPMTYFSYKNPRYAPDFHWYRAQLHGDAKLAADSAVDWARVACNYDFLLVTMPYDPAFIHVPTVKVASNDAAALLAVDKRACPGGGASK